MISTANNEGIQLFCLGEYHSALRCFHRALLGSPSPSTQYPTPKTKDATSTSTKAGKEAFVSTNMDFDEGMDHYNAPLSIPSDHLDPDLTQAYVLFNIGIVYSRTNNVPEAEAHFFRVMSILDRMDSIFELQYGATTSYFQDPSLLLRLAVLHNLAFAHYKENEHVNAVRTYTKVLAAAKNIAGVDGLFHLEIASAFNCLGVALSCMALTQSPSQREKCLEEATHLLTQALNIRRTVVGPIQNLEEAAIINNIGRVYFLRGCIENAQSNYEVAYRIRTNFLEENHIDVAVILYNIGQVNGHLGNISKALSLYHRCLNSLSMKFGISNPRVTRILLEIADIHLNQDRLDVARDYYIQALSSAKEVYDEYHPEVASILSKLSEVSLKGGNFTAATTLLNEVLSIQMMHYNAGHPTVIDTMDRLAVCYEMQDNLKLAIETHERILVAHNEHCCQVECCSLVINTLTTIGILHSRTGNYPQAVESYREILKLEKSRPTGLHDENKVEMASVLNIIGLLYFKMKVFDLAIHNFEESLQLYKNSTLVTYSSSPPLSKNGISIVLYNIASSYKETNDTDSALKYYKEALLAQQTVKNESNVRDGSDVCAILIQIGKLYQELGKIDEALTYFQEALDTVQNSDSSQHDKIKILTCIGNLYFLKGDYAEARVAFDQASSFICCPMDVDDVDDADTEEEIEALYKKNLEILSMQLECRNMKSHCAPAA